MRACEGVCEVFFDGLWLCRITWAVGIRIDGALDTMTNFPSSSFALHFPHNVDVVLQLYANLTALVWQWMKGMHVCMLKKPRQLLFFSVWTLFHGITFRKSCFASYDTWEIQGFHSTLTMSNYERLVRRHRVTILHRINRCLCWIRAHQASFQCGGTLDIFCLLDVKADSADLQLLCYIQFSAISAALDSACWRLFGRSWI